MLTIGVVLFLILILKEAFQRGCNRGAENKGTWRSWMLWRAICRTVVNTLKRRAIIKAAGNISESLYEEIIERLKHKNLIEEFNWR